MTSYNDFYKSLETKIKKKKSLIKIKKKKSQKSFFKNLKKKL